VDRPNLMIKVVATPEGVQAVEALIAAGVNVNITLMFSMAHYEAVAGAYIRGLQRCSAPEKIASVASFFVSRVDTQVDKALDALGSPEALALRGKIAIANSKKVYQRFREIFDGDEFSALRKKGAHLQRPLWASTSTKNPSYRDVLYVEELIGPDTVNTIPPATMKAFRDHGRVRGDTVQENLPEADAQLQALAKLGIDLKAITDKLQVDGVVAFASAYDRVLGALEKKRNKMSAAGART
jgi:transaldolase